MLPFTNLSGDASKDYFSDGMSEELLNLLARVPGLQVAARTSAFAFKGRNVDIREVGKELGVETVLEGSVRQSGDQVRITAQLIDTESGFHLWSETYDRKLQDIFAVQDEIAQAIVEKLKIELAPEEQQLAQRDKAPTQNVEAYELYLQGRAIWKRRGEDNLKRAIDLYQSALARDPGFARAHAALASAYVVLPGYTQAKTTTRSSTCRMAEQSARQALALDPNIGEAHAVLAQINSDRGNLLDAESGFFFAISLEPNEPTPHHWYSILLQQGRAPRRGARTGAARVRTRSDRAGAGVEPGQRLPDARRRRAGVALLAGSRGTRHRPAATTGVEATIAMRRGQWDEAKRLLLSSGRPAARIPAEGWPVRRCGRGSRPSGRASSRACGRRPEGRDAGGPADAVPGTRPARPGVRDHERVARRVTAWRGSHDWDLMHCVDERRASRSARIRASRAVAERIGLVDYWKQYGYPDDCSAGSGDRALVCRS